MGSPGTKPDITDQRYGLFGKHFLSKSKINEFNSMRVMAGHHIFGFEIPMKDLMFVKDLKGGEHLVGDEGNGFDVEIASIFFEYAIEVIIEFFHNHIGILLENFVGVDRWESFGIHKIK